MKTELAETWYGMVCDQPEDSWERIEASTTLANALAQDGKPARAEAMLRRLLLTLRRVAGADHTETLVTVWRESGYHAERLGKVHRV